MRLLKIMLSLMALLTWSAAAGADYNPTNPPEPGVNFMLSTKCIPAEAGYGYTSSGIHAFGSSVWMNVYSNTGFRFVDWEDAEGNVVSTERSFNYTMPPQDVMLIARFIYDPENPDEPGIPEIKRFATVFTKVVPAEAGYINISNGDTYEVGSVVKCRVYSYSNYVFKNWTVDGNVISESSQFDYTIPKEDHTLVANFEYSPENPNDPGTPHPHRTLTLKSNLEGAGSLSGGGSYPDGTSVRVQAYVNKYFTFVNWTDEADSIVSKSSSFNYVMPARNVSLTANYTYDYNPENPAEPDVPTPPESVGENMVAYPRFGMWDDTHVMILCETPGAIIHYTLDGSDPDGSTAVYQAPVYVERNLVVKAIAMKDGMENSPVRSFQVSSYHAAAPVFKFVKRKVQISSDTPGATIRFTTDFSEPNEESEVYTSPLEPEENCRIKAYASKEGLTDSNISIYVYRRADNTLAPPSFKTNAEGQLVIVPAVDDGITYYTIDGTDPDATSDVYISPLTLEDYTVVRAYTAHEDYFDSAIAEHIVDVMVQESQAIITENYMERKMVIEHPDSLNVLIYVNDKDATEVGTPYVLDIVPGMEKVSVVTVAANIHHSNSEPVEREIVFLNAPSMTYNGHTIYVSGNHDNDAPDSIHTHFSFNEISAEYEDGMQLNVEEFGSAVAFNWSENAYRSDEVIQVIDSFNTGKLCGARNGHRLDESFGTWEENRGDDSYLGNYDYLRVVGELEIEDLRFLASLPELTTLRLDNCVMPEEPVDKALSDSRIEAICSDNYPEGLLKGMSRLATVIWNQDDSQMPAGRVSEAGNPNILVWVSDSSNAPSDAKNIVVYDNVEGIDVADPDNEEIEGTAESIQLVSGYPFNVHHPVDISKVEFAKAFTMPTEMNECQGWESIVLPFTPLLIYHQEKEEMLFPYAQWSMSLVNQDDYTGPKPFWLFKATSSDWEAAPVVEAGVPYIISMPNNPYYIDEFNIPGTVVFHANETRIERDDCRVVKSDWINGTVFKGTFMPVEENHLALNGWLDVDGMRPGSTFVSDVAVKPFECYVSGGIAAQANKYGDRIKMPVFGNVSGLTLPTVNDGGLIVLPEGVGSIRIMSDKDRTVKVFTATGLKVKDVHINSGDSIIVNNLLKGIYIVAGKKVLVR